MSFLPDVPSVVDLLWLGSLGSISILSFGTVQLLKGSPRRTNTKDGKMMLVSLRRKLTEFSGNLNLKQRQKSNLISQTGRRIRREMWSEVEPVAKERVDCVVIGGGVVGIAVARELSQRGRDVLVVEAAATFGTATSSRNSEVIHAGIYYPRDSLKASLCVRGRDLLYKYCAEREIPHKKIGKLIVATGSSEIPKLNQLMHLGTRNGVLGLKMLEGFEAMEMEPNLRCVKALLSPESGILDSHSLMLSLVGEAENRGTTLSYNTTVLGGRLEGNRMHLYASETRYLEQWDRRSALQPQLELIPNLVVNSAGLGAQSLALRFRGIDQNVIPAAYHARGSYFSLLGTRVPPFEHLIYPIPEEGGLGVHVTIDLNGQTKFGPDVQWIDGVDDTSSFLNKFDYSVNPEHVERFYPEIRKYYPDLKDGSLLPGYSGIRPKISGPNECSGDFMIQGKETHGIPGLVNLFGIESPGLTSGLAIAEHIADRFLK